LLAFGFPLAASTAVLESVMNVDYLIVGRELYGAALGVYLLAFNLSSWPVSVLSVAIARVSFAGYSALGDDHARLDRGFAHSVAVALSFTVPLVALLMWLASDLVSLLYGTAWTAAAAPLRWLVFIGGVRVMLTMAGEVLAVTGRVGTVLWLRVVWLAALPVPLMLGAEAGGLRGVAMAHVLVGVGLVVPLFLWRLHKAGFDLAPLARSVVRPLLAAMAAVLSMSVPSRLMSAPAARIVVLGALGSGVYLLVLLPANPVVRALWGQLRGRGALAELA
jgi:PST family polysaccharide transporter